MNNHILLKENIYSDFSIKHCINTKWVMNNFHFHDVFEIYYSLSEGVKYFVEDKVYPVEKGDLFVFNHMELHKSLVPDDIVYDRYIVTFSPEYIQDISTPSTDLLECFLYRDPGFSHRIHLSPEQSQKLLSLFDKAENLSDSNTYGVEVYRRITLAEILLLVNSFYKSSETSVPAKAGAEYKRIKPVLQYIHNNLDSDISLDNLAQTFYISKHHLGYLFKKATGFTLYEYVIHRRIMKARELLKMNLPVSQVSEMVGFHSYSHFIRTFSKLVGTSPKQYAKKHI